MGNSAIAVLIPVFNRLNGLLSTLDSLRNDDEIALDIYVVDDGSAPPIQLPSNLGIHTVSIIRLDTNSGIESALNAGIQHILENQYQFIGRIDAEDTAVKGRFIKQYNFMLNNPDCGVLGTGIKIVDHNGNQIGIQLPPLKNKTIIKRLHKQNVMKHPSVMIRAEVFRKLGLYSNHYPAAEDYELFLRIAKSRKFTIQNLGEALTVYARSPDSIGIKRFKSQLWSDLKIKVKYFNPRFFESYCGLISTNTFKLLTPMFVFSVVRRIKKWRAL